MANTEEIAIPEALREDIDRAVRILKEGGCTEVYLFGSVAKGKVRDGSDIDLAVKGCPTGSFFHLMGKLLMELERSADLVDLDSQDPFAEYLERRGELVRVG